MTEPIRLRRRHRHRHDEMVKARLWVSTFGDGLPTAEAARLHGVFSATGRTARGWIEQARNSRIPAVCADLRARNPGARVDDLARRLLAEIARGADYDLPNRITATEAKWMERQAALLAEGLAARWGCSVADVEERIAFFRYEATPGENEAEARYGAAQTRWLQMLSLQAGTEEGQQGVPPLPEYHDPHAHEKFRVRYEKESR